MEHTAEFYRFYRDTILSVDAKPNKAHLKIAQLERAGKLKAVITQNIDGLHQQAGSRTVLELHGSVHRNSCGSCDRKFGAQYMRAYEGDISRCPCGGIIKPDVVLYEEALDGLTLIRALDALGSAKLLIIGGTSLNVYPAAGLIRAYKGKELILINRSETPVDGRATLVIRGSIGETLDQVKL